MDKRIQLVDEVARAAADVAAAQANLDELTRDETIEPRTLARLRVDGREQLEIMHERHAAARERLAAHFAAERAARIADLRGKAADLKKQAEHAEASAVGQLRALFGDAAAESLLQTGRRPLNAAELFRQAANLEGQADCLAVEK
jgi:hypothetical protein